MVNQRQFWAEIHKNNPKYKKKPRVVPAFTIQALQENTIVAKPPKCGLYKPIPPKPSNFRKFYERGLFPISIENDSSSITWKVNIEELDFHHYLPMFFDGLTETEHPYKFLVEQGISDMLEHGGPKILPVVPQLIIPIKSYNALNTKVPEIICTTMRALQWLVRSADCVGESLVPYFRQILPIPNLLKDRNVNLGEGIDYSQQRGENPADLIQETLEVLERYGGEDAFINIKYMVPTYESCMMN